MIGKLLKLLLLLSLFTGCRMITVRTDIQNADQGYYEKQADRYYSTKNWALLRYMTRLELQQNPDNYHAAWYNALLLQHSYKFGKSLSRYIEFIEQNPQTPDEYKSRWIELAFRATDERRIRFENNGPSFLNFEVEIPLQSNQSADNSKISEDRDNYYFLTKDGSLYIIRKLNKKIIKINYYVTSDFALFDKYIIFNDSINLIRYDLETGKYSLIHTFDSNNITFSTINQADQWVIAHSQQENVTSLNYFDLKNGTNFNLPTNCIAQAPGFTTLIMTYDTRFTMIDISGSQLTSIEADFLGYGTDDYHIYYYQNNFIVKHDIQTDTISRILFIPDINHVEQFVNYNTDQFTLIFDNRVLMYYPSKERVFLSKINRYRVFQNGLLFMTPDSNSTYFVSNYDLVKNLVFSDTEMFSRMVYSDKKSTLFALFDNNLLTIFNLGDIFIQNQKTW